jgi:catechol 2,3-dioxygenase-like lactoylglutathione lyase family enzyme
MLRIDHIGIAARDAKRSAEALAQILGAPAPVTEGADDDMYRIDFDHGAFVVFNPAVHVNAEHIAFHVDTQRFHAVVSRLRAKQIAFGNDPQVPANGRIDDPLGGQGRVYFADENGHLFEVCC